MKTLNVANITDVKVGRPVYYITSCIPLGIIIDEIVDDIPCFKCYYILSSENDKFPFLCSVVYIDLYENYNYLDIKNNSLYSGKRLMKHFLSMFTDVTEMRTDLQFFVPGSPGVLQNRKEEGAISTLNRFVLSNDVFLKMSRIHESILYLDSSYDDEASMFKPSNINLTKIFETTEVLDIDYDVENSYKVLFKIQDSNRMKYTLSVNMPFDEFTKAEEKKIMKYIKKRKSAIYMDPSIYENIHILTNPYINGVNCSNTSNMTNEIINKNGTISMDIMFIFCSNDNGDTKIFYFDNNAKEKLSEKIRDFI